MTQGKAAGQRVPSCQWTQQGYGGLPSWLSLFYKVLKASSFSILVMIREGGKPINPRQPVLGSFLLCFKMLNICIQREDVFWQQPLIKVSFIGWAYRPATEQYFCWKTPPRGPLLRKKCLLTADPGSPGTGSLPAHGACPALGGRLGLIAEGAAFF